MDFSKRLWIGMVVLGAGARLIPHPWNFTPLMAIGLFAGTQARMARTGVLATVSALALSDGILGFYSGFWYVYGAALIAVWFGRLIRNRGSAGTIAAAAVASSVSFFAVTNSMVWVTGSLYPHTTAGLAACFWAALPFFRNQLLGDGFYTVALFGGYAAFSRYFRPLEQAA
jgi:hypothetical protein